MTTIKATTDIVQATKTSGYLVAVGRSIGGRRHMEDRHVVAPIGRGVFLGVFDGHNGSEVSTLLSMTAGKVFRESLKSRSPQGAMVDTYYRLNETTKTCLAGSTAATAFCTGCTGGVYAAGVGDAAVFAVSVTGVFRRLTKVHRLSNRAELERVRIAGARLDMPPYWGNGVQYLMPTRGFGDTKLMDWGLIANPDCDYMDNPSKILLGTDGLTDGMRVSQIKAVMMELSGETAVTELLCAATRHRRSDNVTVILAGKI